MLFRKKRPPVHVNPFEDETSLGNILVKMGSLTKEQLYAAVGEKVARDNDDLLFGALLRARGYVDADQVANALRVQSKLRKGDSGEAAMLMLEMRTAEFSAGEQRISEAIEQRKQLARDSGEKSGCWTIPLSPLKA